MKKRILSVLLCAVMVLSMLTACGGGNNGDIIILRYMPLYHDNINKLSFSFFFVSGITYTKGVLWNSNTQKQT